MSKRAVSFILTFVLTISLFLVSALTAFGEELNPETAAVSEEGTGTDPLLSEDTSIPITTENQTTKLDFPLLTVNAISNYFGKVADESGKPTGLYQARIDGIYTSGEKMEWYMYWPIWSAQTSASMGTLVNDYYYE